MLGKQGARKGARDDSVASDWDKNQTYNKKVACSVSSTSTYRADSVEITIKIFNSEETGMIRSRCEEDNYCKPPSEHRSSEQAQSRGLIKRHHLYLFS